MLCTRSEMAVINELQKLDLHFMVVDLGIVKIMQNISNAQIKKLRKTLYNTGFELINYKGNVSIEKI